MSAPLRLTAQKSWPLLKYEPKKIVTLFYERYFETIISLE